MLSRVAFWGIIRTLQSDINICYTPQGCISPQELKIWRARPQLVFTFNTGLVALGCAGLVFPESIATRPPFGPIEGQKWFNQFSSLWESQKNRFALISFGNIQFLPPCNWNLPFMSYRLGLLNLRLQQTCMYMLPATQAERRYASWV